MDANKLRIEKLRKFYGGLINASDSKEELITNPFRETLADSAKKPVQS